MPQQQQRTWRSSFPSASLTPSSNVVRLAALKKSLSSAIKTLNSFTNASLYCPGLAAAARQVPTAPVPQCCHQLESEGMCRLDIICQMLSQGHSTIEGRESRCPVAEGTSELVGHKKHSKLVHPSESCYTCSHWQRPHAPGPYMISHKQRQLLEERDKDSCCDR